MAEMDEKLGAILNDPDKMQQIMAMASSIMGKMSPGTANANVPEPSANIPVDAPPQTSQVADMLKSFMENKDTASSATAPSPSSAGVAMLPQLLQMFGGGSSVKSEKANLLSAIKPYVKDGRAGNIDRALKMANMAKSAKSALGGILPK